MENLKVIFEDRDLLVIDKPANLIVIPEGEIGKEKTLIDLLIEEYPGLKNTGNSPRYGIIHRLDKDTSGIILVAKNNDALIFFQKEFAKISENTGKNEKNVIKKYLALVIGEIKENEGFIDTLIGRSPKDRIKQKAYIIGEPGSFGKRTAQTNFRVLKRFEGFTLLEVEPKTGRKHQIRTHLAYLSHPIAGDKLYGFKNQPLPKGLTRQFLHAAYLKIKMPSGDFKEFNSELPEELKNIIKGLNLK